MVWEHFWNTVLRCAGASWQDGTHYYFIQIDHCCWLDGQLFAWGSNSSGQLGLGSKCEAVRTPSLVSTLSGVPLAFIATGGSHSFALSKSGEQTLLLLSSLCFITIVVYWFAYFHSWFIRSCKIKSGSLHFQCPVGYNRGINAQWTNWILAINVKLTSRYWLCLC